MDGKADASPVTEADRGAEIKLREFLAARFPEHGIWGEEFGADRADAEWVWLLDPIDGTRAFITGRPLFTTLISLMHRGRPVLGIIDQPATGERWVGVAGQRTRFSGPFGGVVGGGAYIPANGMPRVLVDAALGGMVALTMRAFVATALEGGDTDVAALQQVRRKQALSLRGR